MKESISISQKEVKFEDFIGPSLLGLGKPNKAKLISVTNEVTKYLN